MPIFVSGDVETSGPVPGMGELLTLGAVAMTDSGEVIGGNPFYVRLLPEDLESTISASPMSAEFGDWQWEPDTKAWWLEQDKEVLQEAVGYEPGNVLQPYAERDLLERVPPAQAMGQFALWLDAFEDPVFVAHPACFDWQWVNCYLWKYLGRNPMGYRALCLRSMGFGMSDLPWGEDRTDDEDFYVPSQVPHHAFYDAAAQAEMLAKMLDHRSSRLRVKARD